MLSGFTVTILSGILLPSHFHRPVMADRLIGGGEIGHGPCENVMGLLKYKASKSITIMHDVVICFYILGLHIKTHLSCLFLIQ